MLQRHPCFMAGLAMANAPNAREGVMQLFLSYQDTLSNCHMDEPPSVLTCLGGVREVALLPPTAPALLLRSQTRGVNLSQTYNLYEDEGTFGLEGRGVGLRQSVVLTPGMALYIPPGWWHQIRASAGSVGLAPLGKVRSVILWKIP